MIDIQFADIIGILKTTAPYLIALGIAMLLGIIIMIACRKMIPSKDF